MLLFLLLRVGLPGVIGDSGITGAPCSETLSSFFPFFVLLRLGLPGVIGDTTSDSTMLGPCSDRLSFFELLLLLLRLGLPGVTGGDNSDSGSTPCSERLSFLAALLLLLFRRSVVAGLSGGGAATPCSDDRLKDFILLGFLLPLLLLRLAAVGLVAFSSNSRSRLLRDFGLPLLTRLVVVTPGVGESKL